MTTPTNTCSIEQIYKKYYTDMKQYFLKYTHDVMKAEDMAHDLFLKLIRQNDIIMPQTVLALLITIASRMVVSDARHTAFVRRAMTNYYVEPVYEDMSLTCREIERAENKAVMQLAPKTRRVYMAARFEGKKADEIAKEMTIQKRTVESHLFVARREVRGCVRKAIAMGA